MSIFGTMLSKLGFGDDRKKDAPTPHPATQHPATQHPGATPNRTAAAPQATRPPAASPAPAARPTPTAPPAPAPAVAIGAVDVVAKLEKLAAAHGEKLNWKVSIVDLMKLLDMDSSLSARKALAAELGYTGSTDDSAAMNMWLHKAVLRKLAENGGNVPAELLD